VRPYFFSGSSLALARRCPASSVLPKAHWSSPAAAMGSAIHEHLADRVSLGLEDAFARLPEIAKRWELVDEVARIFFARCRAFKYTPPAGAVAEFALGLNLEGAVRECVGARGEYAVREGTILPLTLDVMWAEPEPLVLVDGVQVCPVGSVLWVIDWKSGLEEHVDAAEINRQILSAALMAGRYTGARYVMPAIVYVRAGDGEWDCLEAPVELDSLAWVEKEIRDTHEACVEQARRLAAGEALDLAEGQHCLHCGARDRCPAKTAMVQSVMGDAVPALPLPLTPEQRLRLATMLPQLQRWHDKAEALLHSDVEASGPIDLGDGRQWGPHAVLRDEIDPEQGLAVLASEIGEEGARSALTVKLPKSGIEEAVKTAHAAAGIKRQVSPTVRRVFAKLKEAGAIQKVSQTRWEAHKVAAEIEAEAEDK
jgi:hypothetical protein